MSEWVYLSYEQLLEIHEHVHPTPVTNENTLRSALNRPLAGFGGIENYPTLMDKGAALLYGLARSQGFLDGNKRTAIRTCVVFMGLNGMSFTHDSDEEVAFFVESVAKNERTHEQIVQWMVGHFVAQNGM